MTKRQARSAAASAPDAIKKPACPADANIRSQRYAPALVAPLRLYSVFLLGAFAMKPGPASGRK